VADEFLHSEDLAMGTSPFASPTWSIMLPAPKSECSLRLHSKGTATGWSSGDFTYSSVDCRGRVYPRPKCAAIIAVFGRA